MAPAASVSANVGKVSVEGDFASVIEQSGIKGGDGGFQLNVTGNTDLTTGQLPGNYVTKAEAYAQGWQEGQAVNNYVVGGQIGGDVFRNSDGLLPLAPGRTWYEADIGLSNIMARGNTAQPASRLLYSSDGLLYVTSDHYQTMIPIGRWKD